MQQLFDLTKPNIRFASVAPFGIPHTNSSPYFDGPDDASPFAQPFSRPIPPTSHVKQAPQMNKTTRWGEMNISLASVTPYFTQGLIKAELPNADMPETLNRIQSLCKENSIQARFEENPATLYLQTVDQMELRVKFWKSVSGDNFYIDIQRIRGDELRFNRLANEIVSTAKGTQEVGARTSADMDVEYIQSIEAIVDKVAPPVQDESVTNTLVSAIDFAFHSLKSSQFGDRRAGLEALLYFTDLGRTTSSLACPISIVVLTGEGPKVTDTGKQTEIDEKCATIQNVLFKLIQEKDFDGDDLLRQLLKDAPVGMQTFMPAPFGTPSSYPAQYADAIGQYFNLGLSILTNSLETLTCFARERGLDMSKMSQSVFVKCQQLCASDIYETLVDCVAFSKERTSDGFLAAKAIRFMAISFPELRFKLANDVKAKEAFKTANRVGETSHAMLLAECKKLSKIVSSW